MDESTRCSPIARHEVDHAVPQPQILLGDHYDEIRRPHRGPAERRCAPAGRRREEPWSVDTNAHKRHANVTNDAGLSN